MLDALAGPMPGDKFVIRDPFRRWSEEVGADAGRLRIAMHAESWSQRSVDAVVVNAVEAVARRLDDLGHDVELASPCFEWEDFIAAMTPIMSTYCAAAVQELSTATGRTPGPDTLERTTLACYEYGRTLSVLQLAAALQTVNTLARAVGQFFERWDLLITPTVTAPPPELGYLNADDASVDAEGWMRHIFDLCSFTPLFNVSGTPAISLPLGWTPAGLPIGVQLAAPMCEEAMLIRVASQLEEAMPWGTRQPAVHATRLGPQPRPNRTVDTLLSWASLFAI
jgi:amidase